MLKQAICLVFAWMFFQLGCVVSEISRISDKTAMVLYTLFMCLAYQFQTWGKLSWPFRKK